MIVLTIHMRKGLVYNIRGIIVSQHNRRESLFRVTAATGDTLPADLVQHCCLAMVAAVDFGDANSRIAMQQMMERAAHVSMVGLNIPALLATISVWSFGPPSLPGLPLLVARSSFSRWQH